MIRWETLRKQVANRVNIQPITTGEIVLNIGNLDILISNKFILGRNNDRFPTGPLTVTSDPRKIIRANMTSRTTRGTKDALVIHQVDELGTILELGGIARSSDLQ